MGYRFNIFTTQLDLVGSGGSTTFDPNTIVTNSLTPFGDPLTSYDMVASFPGYFVCQSYQTREVVIDSFGNVVTI